MFDDFDIGPQCEEYYNEDYLLLDDLSEEELYGEVEQSVARSTNWTR